MKQKLQFAVILTELTLKSERGLSCCVVNEAGEKFEHYHCFKIGEVVELVENTTFANPRCYQLLRPQDFYLLL